MKNPIVHKHNNYMTKAMNKRHDCIAEFQAILDKY